MDAKVPAVLELCARKLRVCTQRAHQRLSACMVWGSSYLASLLVRHPRVRASRNALCHFLAFLVGSTFDDECIAFSKPKLTKDDSYRDRLLEPEIADLVDLSDALQLTIPQRKGVFQCFLHVDFMRRSGVTRTELLRYCDLRPTPLTSFLLPEPREGATHRSGVAKRWDILQWLTVCFSVCTLDVDTVGARDLHA